MAEYTCRLGTPTGEIITRTVEAGAEGELRAKLEREGFRIFSVISTRAEDQPKSRKGDGKLTIKLGDFLLFNQQLSALLRAGLPILQAINILNRRQKNQRLKALLDDVEERIKSGSALSEAFAASGAFPRIYTASILAGERSGSLDEVLMRYVNYTKTITELRRKIRKSLTYPIILVTASIILISVLTTYVIPRFSELYKNFNKGLPVITQVVVGVSESVQANIYWIAPAFIGAVVAFFLWRRTEHGRLTIDRLLLKIPVIGDLIRQSTTAQVSRSLATLLAGGITLLESYEIAYESITNRQLRIYSSGVASGIREGRSFTEVLDEAGWMPDLAIDMIGVGERSGALREMLDEVASFYDAELDVRLTALTTIIEPAILIFMAILVTSILLSIYLPLLQSVSSLGAH